MIKVISSTRNRERDLSSSSPLGRGRANLITSGLDQATCRATWKRVNVSYRFRITITGRIHLFAFRLFRSIVLAAVMHDVLVPVAQNTVQPEEVQRLKRGQQDERDHVRERALVLLRLPVELVRANRAELREQREDDAQVQVVSEVDPRAYENAVERSDHGAIDIAKCLGTL